jgi:F420H(2)-dependent quinone reductase
MAGNIIFRTLNKLHIFLYRKSGGRILGSVVGSPVLVLTTTGRKTGKPRTVPLVYTHDGKNYAVIATDNPGWHHNLKGTPQAWIEVKNTKIQVRTRDASAEEEAQWWERIVKQSPAFKSFLNSSHHKIVILEPVSG